MSSGDCNSFPTLAPEFIFAHQSFDFYIDFGKTKLERENVFLFFEKIVASHYPDRVEGMSSIYIYIYISLFKALNSRYALPNGLFPLTEYVVIIMNREAIYIQKTLLLYTPLIFK